jgi:hypothetical protein
MKVIIRKYPSYYSTRNIEEKYISWRFKKNFYDVDEKDYKQIDKFVMKVLDLWFTCVCKPMNYLSDLKRKVIKRTYVRIDPWDSWNCINTFAVIAAPLLKQLKKEKHGAPYVDDEDVPEEFRRPEGSPEHETDDNWFLRWEWVLGEIIWAFENMQTDWEEKYYSGEIDTYFEKQDNGLYSMKDGPNHTFSVDTDGIRKEQERMNNALRLFGKYYFCLWD